MAGNEINVLAVGDVDVNRDDPDSIFAHVADTIRSADIAFCQLESNYYSEKAIVLPQARVPSVAHPRNAPAIKKAGFNVVSYAGNHVLDCGSEAFLNSIEILRATGIDPIGVGMNIEEARRPQIIDCKGTKIAFLAYSSVLPMGYWADAKRPGCAPMRAWTVYEQIEHDQPGTPARIHTFANEYDKAAMISDIQKAKAQADIVILSVHWGIHFKEAEIAMYQREYAYAALEAGADVILGHHAHILKATEIYKGKAIFYSLCNFALDLELPKELLNSSRWQELMELNPSWTLDPRYKSYPFPADSRMTVAGKITISDKKVKRVAFLPALINENSQPRFLSKRDKEFNDVIAYMQKVSKAQNIDAKYTVEGNEVIILP